MADSPAQQPLVIAAGLLVGTGIPMGTRTTVLARNQISGGYSYSNVGGGIGEQMKMAGFDALVIRGASPKPVYLLLHDGQAELVPADDLWGMHIPVLQEVLRLRHSNAHLSFIGIGPAGEKQIAVSCLMVEEAHAAGWGGSGVMFGAKNLKAVVAFGSQPVALFDPAGFERKIAQLDWRISASEAMAGLVRGGTHGMAGAGGFSGLVPGAVRNLQDEYESPEASESIREPAYRQWEIGRSGCPGCRIRCLHAYELDDARYGRVRTHGMHANSVRGFGSNLGIKDSQAVLMAHTLCNRYGLDVDGAASAIAFAVECAENGLLERDQPGGVHLAWGDLSLVKLVQQIADGEHLGQLLGRGVFAASQAISGSAPYAMTVKRVGINEQGIRSHRGWALGIMTSTRGGGHLGGSPQTENRRISVEQGERLLGNRQAGDPTAYEGKGRLVAWTEGLKAAIDSLGLCYFVYGWYDLSLGSPEELAELFTLATGQPMTGAGIHRRGLRCHTLERMLSYRLGGFTRKDDGVPERFFSIPVGSGPYAGVHLDRAAVEQQLDEYYAALGWSLEDGLPTRETLASFGLDFL